MSCLGVSTLLFHQRVASFSILRSAASLDKHGHHVINALCYFIKWWHFNMVPIIWIYPLLESSVFIHSHVFVCGFCNTVKLAIYDSISASKSYRSMRCYGSCNLGFLIIFYKCCSVSCQANISSCIYQADASSEQIFIGSYWTLAAFLFLVHGSLGDVHDSLMIFTIVLQHSNIHDNQRSVRLLPGPVYTNHKLGPNLDPPL